MTTQIELLRAIAANLDEDTPRLMYADWLDENAAPNNSYAAKAEYIRLSIRLAREGDQLSEEEREPLWKRHLQLEVSHFREWEKPLHEALGYSKMTAVYERGLINGLVVANPDRLIASQLLYASTLTVRDLTVDPVADEHVPALATQLAQSRVVKLCLRSDPAVRFDPEIHVLTDAAVEPLTRLKNLRELSLVGGEITATGAKLIADRMTGLRELVIAGNPIGDDGAARIATMSGLRELSLAGCGITATGAEALASSATLPLSAKLSGLKSAGFGDMATELERTAAETAEPPRTEWFQTNWKGHPGEILYRAPVAEFTPAQVTELREQVIGALVRDGLSRGFAEARVVVRRSEEMGQDSLTVVGNTAAIALAKAMGRGQLPGVCHTESRWRDSARGAASRSQPDEQRASSTKRPVDPHKGSSR